MIIMEFFDGIKNFIFLINCLVEGEVNFIFLKFLWFLVNKNRL